MWKTSAEVVQAEKSLTQLLYTLFVLSQQRFQIPDEMSAVHLYLEAWYQTDVYKETEYADEEIMESWKERGCIIMKK